MDDKLLISIITVSYNSVQTIEETILSVIHQTYTDIQYIIIDGQSCDGTIDVVNKYKNKISHIVSEPDNGIYDAMNKGLRLASGDFVLFLGSDDHLISNGILSDVSVNLKQNRKAVWYGNVYRPYQDDLYCKKINKFKLAVKNIPHQGLFYPKYIYKNKKYNTCYRLFADYEYNISLFRKFTFKYLNRTISYFNDVGSSATQKDSNFKKDRKRIICTHLGYIPYYYSEVYRIIRNLVK